MSDDDDLKRLMAPDDLPEDPEFDPAIFDPQPPPDAAIDLGEDVPEVKTEDYGPQGTYLSRQGSSLRRADTPQLREFEQAVIGDYAHDDAGGAGAELMDPNVLDVMTPTRVGGVTPDSDAMTQVLGFLGTPSTSALLASNDPYARVGSGGLRTRGTIVDRRMGQPTPQGYGGGVSGRPGESGFVTYGGSGAQGVERAMDMYRGRYDVVPPVGITHWGRKRARADAFADAGDEYEQTLAGNIAKGKGGKYDNATMLFSPFAREHNRRQAIENRIAEGGPLPPQLVPFNVVRMARARELEDENMAGLQSEARQINQERQMMKTGRDFYTPDMFDYVQRAARNRNRRGGGGGGAGAGAG